jgi:hypothetical protein
MANRSIGVFFAPGVVLISRRKAITGGICALASMQAADLGAQPMPDLATVRAKAKGLEVWLNSTKLSDSIELLSVRRAPHPTQEDVSIVHLETRWRKPITTREAALEEFAAFSSGFLKNSGDSFNRKLFFKFARLGGVPLRACAVHVHVADTDLASYIDANGAFVTTASDLRLVRSFAGIDLSAPSVLISAKKAPSSDTVINLIAAHYANRGGQFRRQELDPAFVGFSVEHLRGEVISGAGFWENIEGNLMMSLQQNELRLYLNLDGSFAAGGAGSRPPAEAGFKDMELGGYTKQLQKYAAELLQIWRSKIAEMIQ